MTHQHSSADPKPPASQETFRTVHEVLQETARCLEASSRGLSQLASDPALPPRDSMMLATLSKVRSEAAKSLERIVDSAPRHGEYTWLQYAPVFGNRDQLGEKVAAAKSGNDAYALLTDVDRDLEVALVNLSERSPASRELLRQTAELVLSLQRSSRTIVESAQDI